jgi:hypothetical protein
MKGDEGHSWEFDGDDPYIKCACGEVRDAITGRVIVQGIGMKRLAEIARMVEMSNVDTEEI